MKRIHVAAVCLFLISVLAPGAQASVIAEWDLLGAPGNQVFTSGR